jgi:hypothetical protein
MEKSPSQRALLGASDANPQATEQAPEAGKPVKNAEEAASSSPAKTPLSGGGEAEGQTGEASSASESKASEVAKTIDEQGVETEGAAESIQPGKDEASDAKHSEEGSSESRSPEAEAEGSPGAKAEGSPRAKVVGMTEPADWLASGPMPNLGSLLIGFLHLFGNELDLSTVRLVLKVCIALKGILCLTVLVLNRTRALFVVVMFVSGQLFHFGAEGFVLGASYIRLVETSYL